jgi:hypothetical protein
MRQGADAGQADGEVLVVGIGEANPGGLYEETDAFGFCRAGMCGCLMLVGKQCGSFVR